MNRKLVAAGVALTLVAAGGAGAAAWRFGYLPFPGSQFLAKEVHETRAEQSPEQVAATLQTAIALTALVRQLGVIQDRIAHGDRDALAEQARQLANISASLRGAPDTAWTSSRYVVAMLGYVLGGGDARIVRTYLGSANAHPNYKGLAEGILQFKLRKTKGAQEILGKIDPRTVDRALAGPLALAQASLVMRTNPVEAAAFLDEARLHAPHTAIDEAALRWQMPVLLGQGRSDKALQVASQYFRRYGRSVYAQGAREKFAALFAVGDPVATANGARYLLETLQSVDSDVKAPLYVTLARQALLAGNISLASFSAHAALDMEIKPGALRARAEIYAAAADAPSDKAVAALAALKSVEIGELDPEDLSMREAADQIARSVLGVSGMDGADARDAAQDKQDPALLHPDAAAPGDLPSTMAKAEKAMKQADAFIGGPNR